MLKAQHKKNFETDFYLNPIFRLVKTEDARNEAYSLSSKEFAPKSPKSCLKNASENKNSEDELIYLSEFYSLAPDDSELRLKPSNAMSVTLEENPFLRYLNPNKSLYRAVTGEGQVLLPKGRRISPPYPPFEASPLQAVSRWLLYSFLCLPLTGFLSLIFVSIAASLALTWMLRKFDETSQMQFRILMFYILLAYISAASIAFLFLSRL